MSSLNRISSALSVGQLSSYTTNIIQRKNLEKLSQGFKINTAVDAIETFKSPNQLVIIILAPTAPKRNRNLILWLYL